MNAIQPRNALQICNAANLVPSVLPAVLDRVVHDDVVELETGRRAVRGGSSSAEMMRA